MAALLLALPVAALPAPAVIESAKPAAVAVTVYRSPAKTPVFDLDELSGFALVTETRVVDLPAGPATLRFAGVADGIVPVSAIVSGLPGGAIEKNRDARLLTPAALVDGYLGRHVTLTRTDRKTGRVRVEDATIVSGPAGGVVVRTPAGVEALGCAGLGEHPRYPAVPAGVTGGPVLSVETVSPRGGRATVTLSYLASDFDWTASYVATLAPDGRTLDLVAQLTLANGNAQAFPAAQVQAVAGRLNAEAQRRFRFVPPLRLDCYPLGTTTSDLPVIRPAPPEDAKEDIVVTGMRVAAPMMLAMPAPPPPPPPPPPEDLGDLKLFRAPERVTVAARAQKQVALLARARVPVERLYRLRLPPAQPVRTGPTGVTYRLHDTVAGGLGLPLPAGVTTVYGGAAGRRLLLGTGRIADTTVGEPVRLAGGRSTQVLVGQTVPARGQGLIEASNANPFAVRIEIAVDAPPGNVAGDGLTTVEGKPTWVATLPAGGRATLAYALKRG